MLWPPLSYRQESSSCNQPINEKKKSLPNIISVEDAQVFKTWRRWCFNLTLLLVVTWSVGMDSGTVCRVVLILVDIVTGFSVCTLEKHSYEGIPQPTPVETRDNIELNTNSQMLLVLYFVHSTFTWLHIYESKKKKVGCYSEATAVKKKAPFCF
jgi:hypothetical protein